MTLNFKFHYLPGWGGGRGVGVGKLIIKLNSAQLELELGLSLAKNIGFNMLDLLNKDNTKSTHSL